MNRGVRSISGFGRTASRAISPASTTADTRNAWTPQRMLAVRPRCRLMMDAHSCRSGEPGASATGGLTRLRSLTLPARRVLRGSLLRGEGGVPVGAEQQVEAGALRLDLAAARRHQQRTALLDVLARQAGADQPAQGAAPTEDREG